MNQVTMKTSPLALRLLRIVSALAGEKQYETMERLLARERERLDKRVSAREKVLRAVAK